MTMNELFLELYEEKFGKKISRQIAENLVKGFSITDGSNRTDGEKWTIEDCKLMGDKLNVNFDKISKCDWYLVANMLYSDNFRTAKKYGLGDSFYFDLAYDWFFDVDGDENKTFNYFIHL